MGKQVAALVLCASILVALVQGLVLRPAIAQEEGGDADNGRQIAADPPAWFAANGQAVALFKKGKLRQALGAAKRAYRLYAEEKPFVADSYVTLVANAAAIAERLGGMQQAIRILGRAAALLTPEDEERTIAIIQIRLTQAHGFDEAGRYQDGQRMRLKALTAAQKGLSKTDPRLAKIYLALANHTKFIYDPALPARYLKQAQEVVAGYPEDDPTRLLVAHAWAKFLIEIGKEGEAQKRLRAILAICDHSQHALRRIRELVLGKLVFLAVKRGDDKRADALLRQVIANAEPNGPAEALYTLLPKVPLVVERSGLVLAYDVNPQGRVTNIRVLTSSGSPQWEGKVREAMRRWRFKPAMKDGQPVWSYNHRYRFTLLAERTVPTGSRIPTTRPPIRF